MGVAVKSSFLAEEPESFRLKTDLLEEGRPKGRFKKKVTACTVRIPNEIMAKVDAYCAEYYISRGSWLARAAIKMVEMMEEAAEQKSKGEKDVSQNENV